MTDMQKAIFLKDEGDAWFERNHQSIQNHTFDCGDPVIQAISRVLTSVPSGGGETA